MSWVRPVTDADKVYVDIRCGAAKTSYVAEYVSIEAVRPVFEDVPQIGTDRVFE